MAVFKCYPARWADHADVREGDLVFCVTAEAMTEPDPKGRRHLVTNQIFYRWADSHGHGSTTAHPGQFCTARTLWPDVADPDRGALAAEALAAERLVDVGTVVSCLPDRPPVVEYSRQGLMFLYGIKSDATRDEIAKALALYHGLDPYDTESDYAPEKALAEYLHILAAPTPTKSRKQAAE